MSLDLHSYNPVSLLLDRFITISKPKMVALEKTLGFLPDPDTLGMTSSIPSLYVNQSTLLALLWRPHGYLARVTPTLKTKCCSECFAARLSRCSKAWLVSCKK